MRAIMSLRLLLAVALLAGLVSALALGPHIIPAAAALAVQQTGCVVGTELVSNGGFEDDDLGGSDVQQKVPAGWTLVSGPVPDIYHNGTSPVGNQHVALYGRSSISQAISTTGLGGATLTLSYQWRFDSTVTFGTDTRTAPNTITYATNVQTYEIPTVNTPDTTLLTFAGNDLDAVSLIVTACPEVQPNLTLTVDGTTTGPLTITQGQTVPYDLAYNLSPDILVVRYIVFAAPSADCDCGSILATGSGSPGSGTFVIPEGVDYSNAHLLYATITFYQDNERRDLTSNVIPVSFIDPTPQLPVASPRSVTTDEDTAVTVTLSATDPDTDTGDLIFAIASPPAHGTLSAITGNQVTYTPAANYNGPDSFTFTVSDGTTTSAPATVSITVTAVNDAPVFVPSSVPSPITVAPTSNAGATVTYTPPTATDVDGDPVTVTCDPPSGSRFPVGTTTVTCTANDGQGASNSTATVSFTVTVQQVSTGTIQWIGGPQPNMTYTPATLPAEPTCTVVGSTFPIVQCRVYGYSTEPGTHTLTARARDSEGNASVSTRTYTVTASAPTATPRPATATPRPATATPRPATATPPPATATPVPAQPTATPTRPARATATPVTPSGPTAAPTRAPRG